MNLISLYHYNNIIFYYYGLSFVIVSNQDLYFIKNFWQTLFKLLSTWFIISLTFHLQTNKQKEHANWSLKDMLYVFVIIHQNDCVIYLMLLEFPYNDRIEISTNYLPFFININERLIMPSILYYFIDTKNLIIKKFI